MDGEQKSKDRMWFWLIVTGAPLSVAQLTLSFFLDGWMAPVSAIFGTLIAMRTIDLIFEGT
jgi:hypothetical protein